MLLQSKAFSRAEKHNTKTFSKAEMNSGIAITRIIVKLPVPFPKEGVLIKPLSIQQGEQQTHTAAGVFVICLSLPVGVPNF